MPTHFYSITDQGGGIVDVYLQFASGILVVSGVVSFDGIEDDIRQRFDCWCESGELVRLEEIT